MPKHSQRRCRPRSPRIPTKPNPTKSTKRMSTEVDRLAEDGSPQKTPPSPRRDRRSETLAMNCTVVDLSKEPKYTTTQKKDNPKQIRPLAQSGVSDAPTPSSPRRCPKHTALRNMFHPGSPGAWFRIRYGDKIPGAEVTATAVSSRVSSGSRNASSRGKASCGKPRAGNSRPSVAEPDRCRRYRPERAWKLHR